MAVSLCNNSLIVPPSLCVSSVSSSKPESKAFSVRSFHYRTCNRILGFSFPVSAPICCSDGIHSRRRLFRCSPAVQDSGFSINDEEEGDVKALESGAHLKDISALKTILKLYKEAIFYGDEITISKIEARIYGLQSEKHELVQKISALSAEITTGKEKYIRLQADFENFRKRAEKERLTIRTDAQGEVIESLLPMVDNFERAKQQLKPETEMERKIDTSYQGIYKQFVEIMRSLHVAVVATVGKPFDPSVHEAISREESEQYKEGIVIEEFRRGFLLGGRLLRPAMVKVSAGPGRKKAPSNSYGQPATAAGVDER